ncbi:MAG TPA: methyltransferase domain-containing protein [Candidatus Limnocylindrales bacterium]
MNDTGSYVAERMPGGLGHEMARLRRQALLSWDRELRVLRRFGLADGMAILDVGGGPGFVAEQLLAALPSSTVTVIDRDPTMVAQASALLAPGAGPRLRVVEASATDTGLPTGQFDFALARLVFQHLPDPEAAAREIRRVLRPGGRLVIVDVDDALQLVDPPEDPIVKAMFDRLGEAQTATGGTRFIGRRLPRILTTAGFVNVDIEAVVLHSDVVALDALDDDPGPAYWQSLVDEGRITERERDATLASIEESRVSKPTVVLTVLVTGGEKP